MKYNTISKSNGYSVLNKNSLRTIIQKLGFIWEDYCIDATEEMLRGFINRIRCNIDRGMAFITVKLSCRRKGENKKKYVKRFKKYCSSKNPAQAVRVTINALLRNVHKDVRLIYCVEYPGGESKRSSMLTLGYSINIPEKAIIPVIENRRNTYNTPIYKSRKLLSSKLLKIGRWHTKTVRVGRHKKAKVARTPEEIRLDLAASRWAPKWASLKKYPEKKAKIASLYGVKVASFACKIAHYHGKLGKKKEAKKVRETQNELKLAA